MKKYTFNIDNLYKKIEELYPTHGIRGFIQPECFTVENLNTIIDEIINIVSYPIIVEKNIEKNNTEITCFNEETNKLLNSIFSNPYLELYGHGGAGKKIIETEFKCKFADLQSHFIPLDGNNESVSILNKWPHKDANQIALFVLDERELNPIYHQVSNNIYDDCYTIDNEYFLGYFDKTEQKIHINPNFKVRHNYDQTCIYYPLDYIYTSVMSVSGPEEIKNLMILFNVISNILYACNEQRYLDEEGYKNICLQIKDKINELKQIQSTITPDIFNRKEEVDGIDEDDEWGEPVVVNNSDWDDWDDEPKKNKNT